MKLEKVSDLASIKNQKTILPREHQITVEEARKLRVIDLFSEEISGINHLSRADIILIYTLYPRGLEEFHKDYLNYVEEKVRTKGYQVINKPHYYLKSIIG